MTDLQLEVIKLRWHIDIMEKFFMTLWSSFMRVYANQPREELSRLLSENLAEWSKAGETVLQEDPAIPEDQRAVLLAAFVQEMESLKQKAASLFEDLPQ